MSWIESFEKTTGALGDHGQSINLLPNWQIPETSDLYKVKHYGQVALPESAEPIFVEGFSRVFMPGIYRKYANLHQRVMIEAQARGYKATWVIHSPSQSFRQLWQAVLWQAFGASGNLKDLEGAARLYTDIFVAAVLACPTTDQDIFE